MTPLEDKLNRLAKHYGVVKNPCIPGTHMQPVQFSGIGYAIIEMEKLIYFFLWTQEWIQFQSRKCILCTLKAAKIVLKTYIV